MNVEGESNSLSSFSVNERRAGLLQKLANGSPLPFIRGEGQGEGLLLDARVHGNCKHICYRPASLASGPTNCTKTSCSVGSL